MDGGTILQDLLKTINISPAYKTDKSKLDATLQFLKTRANTTAPPKSCLKLSEINKNKPMAEIVDRIFANVKSNLPIEEDSVDQKPGNHCNQSYPVEALESYKRRFIMTNKLISIYDVFYDESSPYREALFSKYKQKIQLVLVNVARLAFTYDLLKSFGHKATLQDTIFTTIALTSNKDSGISLPSHMTFSQFLRKLKSPPDWEFCKLLMNKLKLSYVAERNGNDEVRLYNKKYFTNSTYILVEFENLNSVFLKCVYKDLEEKL